MEITVEQCCERLRNMDDIVILCHRNPDGDTLGSGFALHYILKQLGKRSRVECHDGFPKQYSYMFREYEPEEYEPKAVVAVDIADEQLFGGRFEKYCGRVDLCIDHHGSNKHYAKDWLVRATAAATAEVIEDLCSALGVPLTKIIADCIYTGVATDTGCFCYSNTTEKSHACAINMFRAGCDFAKINRLMFETKSTSRIAIEKAVLNTVEYHFDKKCALVYITKEMMDTTGALESELEGVAAMPRQIEGVEVGITLRQRDDGFKISLRTGDEVDASVLCTRLGGGGHRYAAGCFVKGTLDEAKKAVLKAVGEVLGRQEDLQ